jgi:hypothetical protein
MNDESRIAVPRGLVDLFERWGVLNNKYVPAYPFRLNRTFPPPLGR